MSFIERVRELDLLRWLRHAVLRSRSSGIGQLLFLDYRFTPEHRYGHGKPPHPLLRAYFDQEREQYAALLQQIIPLVEQFTTRTLNHHDIDVFSRYFTGLDALLLYSLIRLKKPQQYIEVGSGNSTHFARMAIEDEGLSTRIISIDAYPRRNIAQVADTVIEQYLEAVDLTIFAELQANDIIFLDGSHRTFTNSDVTIAFMDILPSLRSGVLMHIHDIFLPSDYPPSWSNRYYSEQYLLACYLLAQTPLFDVVYPGYYVATDTQLISAITPHLPPKDVMPRDNVSFWLQMR